MADSIAEARIRAQSFWYRDGLSEIWIGIICLLQNGFTLAMHFGNDRSSWYRAGISIYLLLFLMFAIGAPRIMTAIRERITYPRIGYALSGKSMRTLRNTMVGSTVLAIFALLLAIRYEHFDAGRRIHEMPVVIGLFLGGVGMNVAVRYGVMRYLLIGLFAIALGLAIDAECPTGLGVEIWFLGVGCAFLCAGGITAWNFIRTTPLPADAK